MEAQSVVPSLHHEREDTLPEKPLELDTSVEGNGNSEKKSMKQKFISVFTKQSSRQNQESEVVAPLVGSKDAFGQGDGFVKRIPAGLLPQYPSVPATQVESTETIGDTEKSDLPVKSTNISRQENVRVEVHKPGTPAKDHLNPNPGPKSRQQTISKQRKGVTIREPEKIFHPHHQPPQQILQSSRKGAKRNRGSSSETRKSSPIDKPLKAEQKHWRRKYEELLPLVDELTAHLEFYKKAARTKENQQEAETIKLRRENEALNKQIFNLTREMEAWKEEFQKMENKNTALMKVKTLNRENSDLRADIEVHKSVIIRLNKELAYYQDKLRLKYKDTPENIPVYSSSSADTDADSIHPEDDWLQSPRKSLLPLLIAYDEVIAEKDELLKDHEVTIDRFKGRCMEIVQENETLHQMISSNKDKGSISIEEWEFLRTNAEIVLEENDLLHEQVENLRKKEQKLFATYQVKAAEFKQTITQHEAEIRRQKSVIAELEARAKKLSEEHASMAANLHARIPRESHEAMVKDFKRAFEELKAKYESEKKAVCDKLATAEKERESLTEEVANLDNENTHLRKEIKNYENNLAATNEALEQMKTSLLETTSAREATNGVIEDFVKHIQQLASEKNKLVEDLNQQRLLNEQMMTLRSKENDLVKQLHDKIEAMERLHNDEVKSVQTKVKELDETMKTKSERHRRECLQLHELLEEKDRRLEAMEESKKQLQQDLETVWRTTTTTMNASLKNRNV